MGYICGNGEDLDVCDYRIQSKEARGREGERQQGHMKEKMKSDLVDPRICGWRRGGRGREIKV